MEGKQVKESMRKKITRKLNLTTTKKENARAAAAKHNAGFAVVGHPPEERTLADFSTSKEPAAQAARRIELAASAPTDTVEFAKSLYHHQKPAQNDLTPDIAIAQHNPASALSEPSANDAESTLTAISLIAADGRQETSTVHEPTIDETSSAATLSASSLWERAYAILKNDPEWVKYQKVVCRHPTLAVHTVNSAGVIVVVVQKLAKHIGATKTKYQLGGRIVPIQDVLAKVVDILSATKDLGASLTRLNPYASMAWGTLQVFVQAAVTYRDVGALCWDELPRMLRLISQYQTFEDLYDVKELTATKAQLEEALVRLFGAILKYQVVIVTYACSRMEQFKTIFGDPVKSLPQRILDEIESCERHVARLRSHADREINDAKFREIADLAGENARRLSALHSDLRDALQRSHALLINFDTSIQTISEYLDSHSRKQILEWISTIKVGDAHHGYKAIAGTGLWLFENDLYQYWRYSKSPSILWLKGWMGSGKSCLAHLVVSSVMATMKPLAGEALAYFYCNLDALRLESHEVKAGDVLRCILRQLSCIRDQKFLLTSVMEEFNRAPLIGGLSDELCKELLQGVANSLEVTIIVIDGLDESSQDVQQELLHGLLSLLEKGTGAVKIFLSSQYSRFIRDLLPEVIVEIDMNGKNTLDITTAVVAWVEKAATAKGTRLFYKKDRRKLQNAVVERLTSNANGMFRWVEAAFKHIHRPPLSSDLLDRLNGLSRLGTLFSLYDKIYHDITKEMEVPAQCALQTLLTFILYGHSSHVSEQTQPGYAAVTHVVEACSFVARSAGSSTELDIDDLEALCPSLVVLGKIVEGKKQFVFPHKSVGDWLRQTGHGRFSPIQGHAYLAKLCMKALGAGSQPVSEYRLDHGTLKAPDPDSARSSAFIRYSSRNWLDHLAVVKGSVTTSKEVVFEWPPDLELREDFETFLFVYRGADKYTASANLHMTGLQRWHLLGRQQNDAEYSITLGKDGSENVSEDESDGSEDDPSIVMPKIQSEGSHKNLGLDAQYATMEPRFLDSMLPETLQPYRDFPADLFTPTAICALLGHFCNMSEFEEAAFDVTPVHESAGTHYNWKIRSLATTMQTRRLAALDWLVQEINPTAEDLAEALLLNFSLIQHPDSLRIEEIRMPTSKLARLLHRRSLDLQTKCGDRGQGFFISLCDLSSTPGRAQQIDMADLVAHLIAEGSDPFFPVGSPSDAPISEFKTVFHWLLYWDWPAAVLQVAPVFLSKPWSSIVWNEWLLLAVDSIDCSSELVRALLEHGADALATNDDGNLPLQVALDSDCDASVIDALSFVTFNADDDLPANVIDPSGNYFANVISRRCSQRTIEFWTKRGAASPNISTDDRDGSNLETVLAEGS